MKNFILGILTIVILGGIVFAAYQYGKKTVKTTGSTEISPTAALTRSPVNVSPTGTLVGNDRDEHGCIGSAGYSWCESKGKCLRIWEEGCSDKNDGTLIKQALFKKNNWPDDGNITLTVSDNDGKYAKGTVNSQGGGGYFFAAKVNGAWEIVADGNGMIMCSSLTNYPDYPKTLIPSCYDQATGNLVNR